MTISSFDTDCPSSFYFVRAVVRCSSEFKALRDRMKGEYSNSDEENKLARGQLYKMKAAKTVAKHVTDIVVSFEKENETMKEQMHNDESIVISKQTMENLKGHALAIARQWKAGLEKIGEGTSLIHAIKGALFELQRIAQARR